MRNTVLRTLSKAILNLSGSLKPYKMTNVVSKFVDVSRIIFILSMKDIDKIYEAT